MRPDASLLGTRFVMVKSNLVESVDTALQIEHVEGYLSHRKPHRHDRQPDDFAAATIHLTNSAVLVLGLYFKAHLRAAGVRLRTQPNPQPDDAREAKQKVWLELLMIVLGFV